MTVSLACHNRVDPSISVNRNVTVPDGGLTTTAFHANRSPHAVDGKCGGFRSSVAGLLTAGEGNQRRGPA
jgi:hypothetical protein